MSGHTTYQDHSITGVGYETNGSYMIVHDNWSTNQENIYLQYGSGYSDIFMHPVTPGGGSSCPQSGGVILYAHANYDCGGQGANTGYVQQTSPGNYDLNGLGLNEQASSIHIGISTIEPSPFESLLATKSSCANILIFTGFVVAQLRMSAI